MQEKVAGVRKVSRAFVFELAIIWRREGWQTRFTLLPRIFSTSGVGNGFIPATLSMHPVASVREGVVFAALAEQMPVFVTISPVMPFRC